MADDIEFKALLDTGDFDAGMAVLTGGLLQIGSLAVDAFLAAGKAVGQFASESFQGATDAESAMARVGSVIKSTGGAAGLTAQDVQDLGSQFANLAGGTDDTVIAIEEMGLRMGNISKNQMPNFIQTTLDLAAATGIDAVSGARLMAQAYDDPASAIAKFNKLGIRFNDGLDDQVKKMVASGDTAGAYALVMERVGEATSGAAAAGLDTVAGRMELFNNTIKEAGETVASAFLPVLSTLFDNVIAPALPIITKFAEGIGSGIADSFANFPGDALGVVSDLIYKLGFNLEALTGIPGINDFFGSIGDSIANLPSALGPVVDAAMNLGSSFAASAPQVMGAAQMISDFLTNTFSTLGPTLVANVSGFLKSMAAFWDAHGTQIIAIVTVAFNAIATVIGVTLTLASALVAQFGNVINGDTAGFMATLQGTFTSVMNAILSLVGSDLDSFVGSWTGTLSLVGTLISAFAALAMAKINEFLGTWTGVFSLAGSIVEAFENRVSAAWNGVIGAITGAVDAAKGVIQSFVDAIAGVHLPWWLTPGSPTPLETGLWGISDALGAVTNSLPSSVGGVGQSMSTVNNMTNAPQFNLSVNTQDTSQNVIGNFAVMQSLAGA